MSDQNHTPVDHLLDDQKNTQTPPVAVPTKESEPIHTIKPSEITIPKEKGLDQEVIKYIEQRDKMMNLPQDLKDLGVTAGNDETPSMENGPALVISDDKIVQGLHQPVSSSWRWLSELMSLILKQAHYVLKTTEGHVRRVLITKT